MEEIALDAAGKMPLWLNMFLAIIAAFGGLELVKYLFSLRANRRKDTAEAQQEEAHAKQEEATVAHQQAELVRHQIETSNQMLEQMKQQNAYLGEQIAAYQQDKTEDRQLKKEYRYRIDELERVTSGLQRAFVEIVAKKRDAERHYCAVEDCPNRVPKMGDYITDTPDIDAIMSPPRDRDPKTGRFTKKQSKNGNVLHS